MEKVKKEDADADAERALVWCEYQSALSGVHLALSHWNRRRAIASDQQVMCANPNLPTLLLSIYILLNFYENPPVTVSVRSHRVQSTDAARLLRHTSHVAWSVCLCWSTDVLCKKRLKRSGCRLERLTLDGPSNHLLDGGQGRVPKDGRTCWYFLYSPVAAVSRALLDSWVWIFNASYLYSSGVSLWLWYSLLIDCCYWLLLLKLWAPLTSACLASWLTGCCIRRILRRLSYGRAWLFAGRTILCLKSQDEECPQQLVALMTATRGVFRPFIHGCSAKCTRWHSTSRRPRLSCVLNSSFGTTLLSEIYVRRSCRVRCNAYIDRCSCCASSLG